jgi:DNA (cytosine-5)-methyltransferase 1
MNYLSVCSGIEAASTAWKNLGWKAVGFSEIEPFPCAVLAHHYPDVINYGDINGHSEWKLPPIDILVGGTPCQSFSIAGLRKGLEDPRGNIMLTYLRIIESRRPRWIVWENVPGVLSSNGGRDFATFVTALGNMGYGWAYRVLDSQWFGVPQRRKRVFVIGYLGDRNLATEVLFKSESVCRDFKKGKEKGERITRTAEDSSGVSSIRMHLKAFRMQAFGEYADDQTASAMKARDYKDATDLVSVTTIKAIGTDLYNGAITGNTAVPLTNRADGTGTGPTVMQSKAVRRLTPIECERLQGFPDKYTEIPWRGKTSDQCPDGPRYKALGNSMAVPVMRWIGERIAEADSTSK